MLGKQIFLPFCLQLGSECVGSSSSPNFSLDSHLISPSFVRLFEGAQPVSLTFSDTKHHPSASNENWD